MDGVESPFVAPFPGGIDVPLQADSRHPVAPVGAGHLEVAHVVLHQAVHQAVVRLAGGHERVEFAGGLLAFFPRPRSLCQQGRIEFRKEIGNAFIKHDLVGNKRGAVARDEPACPKWIRPVVWSVDAKDAGEDVHAIDGLAVDFGPGELGAVVGLREGG